MLNRSRDELLIFYIILVSCFLLPIAISCAICFYLICKKKRLFQNVVAINQQTVNLETGGNNLTSKTFNLEQNLEKLAKQRDKEKTLAQILAAERCIITNILLGVFLFIMFVILVTVSKQTRIFLYVIIFSTFKAVLPLLTTVANFGTVQFVARQYWSYFQLHGFFV